MPESCGCINGKKQGKTLTCHNTRNWLEVFEDPTKKFPENVNSMDFSDNIIPNISRELFNPESVSNLNFDDIVSLSFANAGISFIGDGAFTDFRYVTNLNLSSNRIGYLSKNMFSNLKKLELLDLSKNMFAIVPGDTFTELPMLQELDISSDYLVCNCLAEDFLKWYKTRKGRGRDSESTSSINKLRLPNAKCNFPNELRGKYLRKVNVKKLPCKDAVLNELPFFELTPSVNQIVFVGDSMEINCKATDLGSSEVVWTINGERVLSASNETEQSYRYSKYESVISSRLLIRNVSLHHAGSWNCNALSQYSNVSKNIKINVLSPNAHYCDDDEEINYKGQYFWPQSLSGVEAVLNCPYQSNGDSLQATRSCDSQTWSPADYNDCLFEDQVARVIQNMMKIKNDLNDDYSMCNDTLQDLDGSLAKDVMGLNSLLFFSIHCFSKLNAQSDLKNAFEPHFLKMMNQALEVKSSIFAEQNLNTSYLSQVRDVVSEAPLNMKNRSYGVISFQNILSSTFDLTDGGIVCTSNETSHHYHCREPVTMAAETESIIDGYFPNGNISYFLKLQDRSLALHSVSSMNHSAVFRIAMYSNGNLFQSHLAKSLRYSKYMNVSSFDTYEESRPNAENPVASFVISNVFSIKTEDETTSGNVMLLITFNTTEEVLTCKSDYFIASWTNEQWIRADRSCEFFQDHRNLKRMVSAVCNSQGTYAVLKNLTYETESSSKQASNSLSHLSMFCGACILSGSLLAIIVSYIALSGIKISREAKHMLVNTMFHIMLLVLVFVNGISKVADTTVCHVVGVTLHYSSLSTILWILISARNIRKEVVVTQQPVPIEPKPQKPMLRFYLIGCGIPSIICGITAAAKIENYNGDGGQYCWLSWETSLYAFYTPAAMVALLCVIFLLLSVSTIFNYAREEKRQKLNSSQQIDETVSLRCKENRVQYSKSGASVTSANDTWKAVANEQSFKARLIGVSVLLVVC